MKPTSPAMQTAPNCERNWRLQYGNAVTEEQQVGAGAQNSSYEAQHKDEMSQPYSKGQDRFPCCSGLAVHQVSPLVGGCPPTSLTWQPDAHRSATTPP